MRIGSPCRIFTWNAMISCASASKLLYDTEIRKEAQRATENTVDSGRFVVTSQELSGPLSFFAALCVKKAKSRTLAKLFLVQ